MQKELRELQKQFNVPSSPFYDLWREIVKLSLEIDEIRFERADEKLSGNVSDDAKRDNILDRFLKAKDRILSECRENGIEISDFSFRDVSNLFPLY